METKLGEIPKKIAELNKEGICTRGMGTFGCACPACYELILEKEREWEVATPSNQPPL